MGFTNVFQLGGVLHALECRHHIGAIDNGNRVVLHQAQQVIIADTSLIYQHFCTAQIIGQVFCNRIVGTQDEGFLQIGDILSAQTVLIQIQTGFILQHQHIRGSEGIIGNVGCTDIGKPVGAVQCAVQLGISILFCQLFPNLLELFFRGKACILDIQHISGGVGQLGAVFPNRHDQIFADQRRAHFFQLFLKQQAACCRINITIYSHRFTRLGISQIFLHSRHALLPHAEQFDFAAGQLGFRLDKIPAVRPQSTLFGGNYQRTSRTGKSGKLLAGLPGFGDIFAHMGVAGGDHQRIHIGFRHFSA